MKPFRIHTDTQAAVIYSIFVVRGCVDWMWAKSLPKWRSKADAGNSAQCYVHLFYQP